MSDHAPLRTPAEAQALAERVAREMLDRDPASRKLGMDIGKVAPGRAEVTMEVRADMLNGHGIVHGGMVFALADTAFAYVCNGKNEKTVAAQASIVFLGSVEQGETLIAEGEEAATAGRSGVTRVAVRTSDGRPIAEFTGYSRTLTGTVIEI